MLLRAVCGSGRLPVRYWAPDLGLNEFAADSCESAVGDLGWESPVVVCGNVTYVVHESGDTAIYVFVLQMISG